MTDAVRKIASIADYIEDLDNRPTKEVPCPGKDNLVFVMWVLTSWEETLARGKAYEWVRAKLKWNDIDIARDQERVTDEAIAIEVLAVAIRDPSNLAKPLFTADTIRTHFASDVIGALMVQYNVYRQEQKGLATEDPRKVVDELVAMSKKAYPLGTKLSYYDTVLLRKSLLIAVKDLATLTNDNSSDSSQLSDSTQPLFDDTP